MKQGQIRIIGGSFRGRKISVPDLPNVRPTPDRVRETLFNWLQSEISGATCLDAFAGSGVLGFESISRGAAHVTWVDQSYDVISLIKEEIKQFKIDSNKTDVYQALTPNQLKKPIKPWSIVFLDPPYQEESLLNTCFFLEEHELLADNAYIYLEYKNTIQQNNLPKNWQLIKSKKTGQVAYHLVHRKK